MPDMACAVGPEQCGNGCDDDRNGYTDADDPACTPQMLVTFGMTSPSPSLWRLILEPTPHVAVLDGNPVGSAACRRSTAPFRRRCSSRSTPAPSAWRSARSTAPRDHDVQRAGGMGGWATTRDVCIFNGELIVSMRGRRRRPICIAS